ncbi:hypothetical protein [Sphingobium herbicidovorans]|uniref:hypothetical protein n=1 Tax=Sphingobium herbicidovorans TaxID=76947 RepID=UPI0012E01228|nr:hypothetical protein [Sphingobium herbicidovorans]
MSAARKERALAAAGAARGRASHGWPRCALGLAGLGAAAAKHSCARTPPRLRLAKGASFQALRAGIEADRFDIAARRRSGRRSDAVNRPTNPG